jgi:hypothetical protein
LYRPAEEGSGGEGATCRTVTCRQLLCSAPKLMAVFACSRGGAGQCPLHTRVSSSVAARVGAVYMDDGMPRASRPARTVSCVLRVASGVWHFAPHGSGRLGHGMGRTKTRAYGDKSHSTAPCRTIQHNEQAPEEHVTTRMRHSGIYF